MKIKILIAAIVSVFIMMQSSSVKAQNMVESSYKSGYAPVNGLNMYYEIHGTGDPIILIHGSFMTIDMNYGQMIDSLSLSNKVIALELQGHGHTADIDREMSFSNFASDIAKLMDHLKIDSADVLGYSLGATIALKLAIDYPEKVKKIIFISSVFKTNGWLPEVVESFKSFEVEFFTHTPLKTAYDAVAPDTSQWTSFVGKMIKFEQKEFDLDINKITSKQSPILIINGDYDGVDLAHSFDLFRAVGGGGSGIMEPLSDSRFAIIPGTTHITLMMQTNELLHLIHPFLSKN